jgi:hypothetical protein
VPRVFALKSFRSPPIVIGLWHLLGSNAGFAFTTDSLWLRIQRILWRTYLLLLGSPRKIHPPFHPKSHKYRMINERHRFPKALVPVQVRAGAPLQGDGIWGLAKRLRKRALMGWVDGLFLRVIRTERRRAGVISIHRPISRPAIGRTALWRHYGRIANARAGNPKPFSTFGHVTTITAPVAGTLSRLAIASIWK